MADRTATSTTYANADGTMTRVMSYVPVHFQDASGAWQNIDTTVRPDPNLPGGLVSGANSFTASFAPLGTGGGVSITTPSGPVSFDPVGAATVAPAVSPTDPSTVVYANAWPNVDLTYQVTSLGVEEHLLLKSAAAATSFNFTTPSVSFGTGLATGTGAAIGGPITKLASDLTPQGRPSSSGRLVAPVVRPSAGAPQTTADPVLASTGSDLTVSLSPAWLAAQPVTAFPVDLDPTWVGGAGSTCFENNGISELTTESPCEMQVGNSLAGGNTYWRSIPVFDYSALDGAHVLNATLTFGNQSAGTTAPEGINVFTATGESFGAQGAPQGGFPTANGGGSMSNSTLTATYDQLTSTSQNGVGLIVNGYETPGSYTYQQFESFTLSLTYDYPPNAIASSSPASGYTAPTPPTLSAVTTDPDGDTIFYDFEVWTAPNGSGSRVTNQTVNEPSGTTAAWQPPSTGMTLGSTYWWQVTPNDGYYTGGPSPWQSFTIAAAPSAPTGVTATGGNQTATVSWQSSTTNGTPATSYTVTSSGGQTTTTSTGTATSATVTGLTNGTSYTFTVVANSVVGSSGPSSPSNSVIVGAPSAPTNPQVIVSGSGSTATATVTWAAATANGAPISQYTVTQQPGGAAQTTGPSGPFSVTFPNPAPTSYDYDITATNAYGTGPAALAVDAPAPSGGSGTQSCSDPSNQPNYCLGSDGSTGTSGTGGAPTVYYGEVGYYDVGVGGYTDYPCGSPTSTNVEGTCMNDAGASSATYVVPYYLGGGAASRDESKFSSPYCFGYAQGQDALNADASDASGYGSTAQLAIMVLDVEVHDDYGWDAPAASNREVIDGFGDAVGAFASNDAGCPNAGNGGAGGLQLAVYSDAYEWGNDFQGTSSGNIPNTPLWTYENQLASGDNPSDFSGADFSWGDSPYHLAWQYHQNPDYDNSNMYACLPYFGRRINGASCPGPVGY